VPIRAAQGKKTQYPIRKKKQERRGINIFLSKLENTKGDEHQAAASKGTEWGGESKGERKGTAVSTYYKSTRRGEAPGTGGSFGLSAEGKFCGRYGKTPREGKIGGRG